MLRKLIFLILSIGFLAQLSIAEVDPLNTFQFNRNNALSGNGKTDRTPWFEWWYYKVVLPEKNKSFYFVYGTVNPWDTEHTYKATRAYVSMGSFHQKQIIEQRWPVDQFQASYQATNIEIGPINHATDKHITGLITENEKGQASWNIKLNKIWAFNATGWATGKNATNIEWYPAQASATCSGEVTVNGEIEVFEDAPCYQDRNWGSRFPEWWTWVVSNHFESSPGTTLAIGGGKPYILDYFKPIQGAAIGFFHNGIEYSWRPHQGDYVNAQVNFGTWELDGINKNHRIKVSATAPRTKFMDLQFMTPQGDWFHDYEALQGTVRVQLYEREVINSKWKLLVDLSSDQAGIEYGSFDELEK